MKWILLFLLIITMTGCGLLNNITGLDVENTDAIIDAGLPQRTAHNFPMGGLYLDYIHLSYMFKEFSEYPGPGEKLLHVLVDTNILFFPGLAFLIGVGAAELGLTATGDVITLPYTVYKTVTRDAATD